jgi:hypothetical protein
MAKQDNQSKPLDLNFTLDPTKTSVLFADGYVITSNENALTFNFSQALPKGDQQIIVSRIAMTRNQAKEFSKNLQDHIEKFEI